MVAVSKYALTPKAIIVKRLLITSVCQRPVIAGNAGLAAVKYSIIRILAAQSSVNKARQVRAVTTSQTKY